MKFLPVLIALVFSVGFSFGQSTSDSLQSLIKQTKSERNRGKLLLELASHYLPSFPDSTIHYAMTAREIGERTKETKTVIRSYSMTGEAYQRLNNIEEALTNYLKAAKLAEESHDKETLGTIYNGIGICYYYMNNIKKAKHYIKQAAQAKLDAKDYTYYSVILSNLASLHIHNQSYQEAFDILLEVEKVLIEKKQYEYLAHIYNSFGAFYELTKPDSDSSAYYYQKSLENALEYKNDLSIVTAYHNLGGYHIKKKNYPQAIDFLKKAIERKQNKAEDKYMTDLYSTISEVYDSLGDYRNAYKYKKMAHDVSQKIFSVEKQKALEELEIKYQSEKQQKEIQQHKEEIQRGKNQRNVIVFIAVLILLTVGFVVYLMFQRKKAIREFEREKLKLFENIVHEIRTPLTLINGPLQVMKQTASEDEKQYIHLMENNSQKLISLVSELLDASKLGKGKYQITYHVGNIGVFIQKMTDNFTVEVAKKRMKLDVVGNVPTIYYSYPANVLEKVITNLVGNAVKYCKPESVIEVSYSVDNNLLRLQVKDNGEGIPKSEQKKVFDRFYRGKINSEAGGTGIGLALVKELVGLANGDIKLTSNELGSLFEVTIPLKDAVIETEEYTQNEENPTLLLAEDDSDIAEFSKSVLQDVFNIIWAKNGQQAIDKVKESLPDIILTDVVMPEKDGIELLQEIKSNELTDHIPVVIFSAKSSLESRLQGLLYGADAYIPKPFSPEELKLTLQNLFTTVVKNREEFERSIRSEKPFNERIKSKDPYISKIIELIIENIENSEYSVNELSDDMAVSRSQLHRKLSALTGFSTTNFIRMIRLEKAKDMLKNKEGNVTEIAYKCGFNSQSYFTKSFTEHFGDSPTKYVEDKK